MDFDFYFYFFFFLSLFICVYSLHFTAALVRRREGNGTGGGDGGTDDALWNGVQLWLRGKAPGATTFEWMFLGKERRRISARRRVL